MDNLFLCKMKSNGRSFQIREIAADEKASFNEFIQNSPYGNIYQSYEWGDLKSASGWVPIRLILEDEKGNTAGASTVLKRRAAGINFLYSPRGPVLDYGNPTLLALFCYGLKQLTRREDAAFWRMDPEINAPLCPGLLKGAGLLTVQPTGPFGGIQPRRVWRVDMTKNNGEIWDSLKKSCRRQVKKAREKGIEIIYGTAEDLPVFYQLLQDTAEQDGFRIRSMSYFEDLWRHLAPVHRLKLALAYYRSKPVSTALTVGFGRGVWDIYAGSCQEGLKLCASYLLTYELLKRAKEEGYSFYDLGGIAHMETREGPLKGLRMFKSRFGGVDVEFAGEFDLVHDPVAYRFWRLGQKGAQLLRRGKSRFSSGSANRGRR